MTEIFQTVDINAELYDFLIGYFPNTAISRQIPRDWNFAQTKPLVLTTCFGGGRMRDLILDPTLITIDVIAPTRQAASKVAREMHALLMKWPELQGNVSKVVSEKRPYDYPHTDTSNPTYTFTLSVTFTAEKTLIERP